ncbi:WAP four-disulfide core domain protein 3 [Monodelphis domestica]|uniref:WAP four-disulfide core domain 3 n=1 Tax=Monodelphis domestica TaxID=13616 RepID=K7E3N7_MONDO|nr:WAP four-disulfide core domain protein 3 [Monodelphis domestica]
MMKLRPNEVKWSVQGHTGPAKTIPKNTPPPPEYLNEDVTNIQNTTQAPTFTRITAKESVARISEKPGLCPKDLLPCKELCYGDDSCPRGEKCCSTGCGHTCQGKIEGLRAGHCPFILQNLCIMNCKTDENCPSEEKCCKSGCGQLCVTPIMLLNITRNLKEKPTPANFTKPSFPEKPRIPGTLVP